MGVVLLSSPHAEFNIRAGVTSTGVVNKNIRGVILMKVIVVYESKYGNTKRVTEKITEGMNEIGEIDIFSKELKEVNLENVNDYDAILIGSPNHMGGATKGIKDFIEELGKLQLNKKMFAVFGTYTKKDFEKGVKNMEKLITEKVLGLKQIVPGLSIEVQSDEES